MATRKSILELAKKDKKIKEMMEVCYLDIKNEDTIPDFISTNVMAINLLLSGRVDGGIPIGKMSMMSAPSMLGKTFIAMSAIKNAQKKGMQVMIIDTERAFSETMADSLGIDTSPNKLYVFQESGIEDLITFILNIFEPMTKEERKNTFVVMDSWGTLITSKTIGDGLKGKDVLDMTEAKKKNKLANIILSTRGTWFIVNHVYDNIGGFGDALSIPGGRKIMFNCDCVLLGMTRAKDKENDEIAGHIITARTHKSRYCKEMKKLKFRIKHSGGLDPYYGILADAIAGGYIVEGMAGKSKGYRRAHIEGDKFVKESEIYNSAFWKPVFLETDIKKFFENEYTFDVSTDILKEQEDLDAIMM